jgi:hypothetical protein
MNGGNPPVVGSVTFAPNPAPTTHETFFNYYSAAVQTVRLFEQECRGRAPAIGPCSEEHLNGMLARMRDFTSLRKGATWLGYIQGVYVAFSPDPDAALATVRMINKTVAGGSL